MGLVPAAATASVIVSFADTKNIQGIDAVATGSGTLNVSALTPSVGSGRAFVNGQDAMIVVGPAPNFSNFSTYMFASGPATFGPGAPVIAWYGSGDNFGILGRLGILLLPEGYISGAPLYGTSHYPGRTVASLGLTPGTYVYTWGSGANADSLTIQVGTPVPEPGPLSSSTIAAAVFVIWRLRIKSGR